MRLSKTIGSLLLVAVAFGSAEAQVKIDKQHAAAAGGAVHIENYFGSVRVIGWDQDQVAINGQLAAGAESIDFDGDEECVDIDVDVPEAWLYGSGDDADFDTDLEIHVPFGTDLGIETVNATIEVIDVNGVIEIETVNGTVRVRGNPSEVEVESMTGDVEVQAEGAPMQVETISGAVVLSGVKGEVAVETVSGVVQITGRSIEYIEVETTSGDIRVEADFVVEGEVELETFSGHVELLVPADVKAQFELTSFTGEISSSLGPKPSQEHRFSPYKQLRFSTGLNEFEICVETHSGNITLQAQ
jgi:hypothetical protein